ncbi:UDP-N-acetylglucosamine 2-epimerase (non-hydrolyzing) [Alphaproteobacteria bacterium]|nr:UDP-N-acetylglucosamine 2-epimerase (non-hydrolyzing) [Alphaproteobacteria bacterium]
MDIITILGARPQFIKAAILSNELRKNDYFNEKIIHTGQHYDSQMSAIFFEQLQIQQPDFQLNTGNLSHGAMIAKQIDGIESILTATQPDAVIVYGDTNSTLAGALAAIKLNIKVIHVEAGLRSFNRMMPEEHNRVLTDHASDLLLAPTKSAVRNLEKEGLDYPRVKFVGDIMFDAALQYSNLAEKLNLDIIVPHHKGDFILATIHRAETTQNQNLLDMCLTAFMKSPLPVIMPLHPRTRKNINFEKFSNTNLIFIEPVGYLEMIKLEKEASLIVTDSGGVQKEAFFHGKPCVTLRKETEWTELIDSGWNRLAPLESSASILQTISDAIGTVGVSCNSFGEGDSAKSICNELLALPVVN